eukprot:5497680-Prymnesium_polylepis.1
MVASHGHGASSRSVPRHRLDSSLVHRRHRRRGVSRSLHELLRNPQAQRTHFPAVGYGHGPRH